MNPTPDETNDIVSLTAAVDRLADRVEDEKQARKLAQRLAAAFLAVTSVVAFVGWKSNSDQGNELERTLNAIEASRADARIVSCQSYNADTVDKINGLLEAVSASSRNPEAARAFLDRLKLHHRDCTPAGITAYFDGDPATDPFEQGTG